MKRLLKLGDHTFFGISLLKLDLKQDVYILMITLIFFTFEFSFRKWGVRIGMSSGDSEVFFKIHFGAQWS